MEVMHKRSAHNFTLKLAADDFTSIVLVAPAIAQVFKAHFFKTYLAIFWTCFDLVKVKLETLQVHLKA